MKQLHLKNYKINVAFLLLTVPISALFAQEEKSVLYVLADNVYSNTRSIFLSPSMAANYLVRLNPYTGDYQTIRQFVGIKTVSAGTSRFDATDKSFDFWGRHHDDQTPRRLSIRTADGELVRDEVAELTPIDVQLDVRSGNTYGLRYPKAGGGLEVIRFEANGFSSVLILDEIEAVSIGTATFDPNRSKYIFTATDNTSKELLYVIDVEERRVTERHRIREFYYNELAYDAKDNKLYGICRKKTNSSQFFFVEIKMFDGTPIIISPLYDLFDVQIGASAIDDGNGTYIFCGTSKNNEQVLYMVDLITGEIQRTQKLDFRITELHVDTQRDMPVVEKNAASAQSVSHAPQGAFIKKNALRPVRSVDDFLEMEYELGENGRGARAVVFDMHGNKRFEKILTPNAPKHENDLLLLHLEPGMYFLKVKTQERVWIDKFIKR